MSTVNNKLNGHAVGAGNGASNGDATRGLNTLRPSAILHRTPWIPPIAISADRSSIVLENGHVLMDAVGGAAVTAVGMGHPAVIKAVQDQVAKMAYVYSMQLSNGPAEELASYLVQSSNGAFELCGFVSGGTEAMEAAIKLARQYWYETGQSQRKNFIARRLSYHGNSLATLSLAYHPARRAPYEDILNVSDFHHVSPAYASRFQSKDETTEQYVNRLAKELNDKILELGPETVAAFVAETVVGATTGVVPAPPGYFKAMKAVCDQHSVLFVLDEVMCGMGRMGTLHAWESFGDNVAPDIQAMAKGLGGGYASIGAVLMNDKVAAGIRDGSGFWQHGHTYQANPIACAASVAVQKVIEAEDLLSNCRTKGALLYSLLQQKLSPPSPAAPYVYEIRGGGLFWGIEFTGTDDIVKAKHGRKKLGGIIQQLCFDKGLVIIGMSGGADLNGSSGDHCILAPAYNVTSEEVEAMVNIFVSAVEEVITAEQNRLLIGVNPCHILRYR